MRAGADLDQITGRQGRLHAVDVVIGEGQIDRLIIHADHVLQQVAGHVFGEALQRQALFGIRAAIHDDDGFHGIGGFVHVTERMVRADDTDHRHPVEVDTLPGAFAHLPAEYGQLADQPDFGVRKTRPGVDVRRAGLHIIAIDVVRGNSSGETSNPPSLKTQRPHESFDT